MTRHAIVRATMSATSTIQLSGTISNESQDNGNSDEYTIHTKLLFDSLTQTFKPNISLTVSKNSGFISKVHQRPALSPLTCPHPSTSQDIDLTHLPLVIPGLTDLHTHIFLHLYSSSISNIQETQESPVERILRATNHLRSALKAGFTTYRDLGTEGVFTADIDVRNAVNRGIIPGPRLFVAGEAIASSGGYAVRSENDTSAALGVPYGALGAGNALATTTLGRISDQADGADGVRAAVRRRLAAGADVVKVYADYRSRGLRWPASNLISRPNELHRDIRFAPHGSARNPAIPLWTYAELMILVEQARSMGATVAAHAGSARGVLMAVKAGVTSIEHGNEDEASEADTHPFNTPLPPDAALQLMAKRRTIWNPTLYILEAETSAEEFSRICARVRRGYELGVRIGVGGDTGPVPHGGNAREMELLVQRCGIPVETVLRAATVGGWEGVWGREVVLQKVETEAGGEDEAVRLGTIIGQADSDRDRDRNSERWTGERVRRFGALREGWVADLVGLGGDVRDDVSALRDVRIVIKDGAVVVRDGRIFE